MKQAFKNHFPSSRKKFKKYLYTLLPIILGSTFFALNGVIDNFMVGQIPQGQAALGAVNSWTNIFQGFLIGTSAVGAVLSAQFFYDNKHNWLKEVSRYRYYLAYLGAIPLAIVAWAAPDILTQTFAHPPKQVSGIDPLKLQAYNIALEQYNVLMENARIYARIIAGQWLLLALSFNYGNQLRELGHGKIAMFWGIGTLTANASLNAILLYGFGLGVAGAAWASVAGRIVAIVIGTWYILIKKLPIMFVPWEIFNVSWETRKLFWRRWVYFFSVSTVILFITIRTTFYSLGYPNDAYNSALGKGVSGLGIVALTGALMSVFTTTFNALSSMAAIFVSSELGKNNLKQAKINSNELKGFSTFIAACLSILLVFFAIAVPYMSFLSKDQFNLNTGLLEYDGIANLRQVRNSLYVIAFCYPIWIWFSCSYRNGSSGGKGAYFGIMDWLITAFQIGWAAIVMLLMVPGSSALQHNFWMSYSIFFLSDLLKLVSFEIYYYKSDKWLHSITKNELKEDIAIAADEADSEIILNSK